MINALAAALAALFKIGQNAYVIQWSWWASDTWAIIRAELLCYNILNITFPTQHVCEMLAVWYRKWKFHLGQWISHQKWMVESFELACTGFKSVPAEVFVLFWICHSWIVCTTQLGRILRSLLSLIFVVTAKCELGHLGSSAERFWSIDLMVQEAVEFLSKMWCQLSEFVNWLKLYQWSPFCTFLHCVSPKVDFGWLALQGSWSGLIPE